MFGKDAIYSDSTCELTGMGLFSDSQLVDIFLRYFSIFFSLSMKETN